MTSDYCKFDLHESCQATQQSLSCECGCHIRIAKEQARKSYKAARRNRKRPVKNNS